MSPQRTNSTNHKKPAVAEHSPMIIAQSIGVVISSFAFNIVYQIF